MIDSLNKFFSENEEKLSRWLDKKARGLTLPFYSSADIRDSGSKAACIDLNIFPAGFNNLCEKFSDDAAASILNLLKKSFPNKPFSNVLIIPEAHSRNKFYNAHLFSLKNILEKAGLTITLAKMSPEHSKLETYDGKILETKPLVKKNNVFVDEKNNPFDWLLLNNDLSDGKIDFLENIEQPVIPNMNFGWHKRRKSMFFKSYDFLIRELAKNFDFDPWLLRAKTKLVSNVDFSSETGRKKVANAVENILLSTQKKYDEYNINYQPRVFIKNDSGTYGIGIMVVSSPDEIIKMNRKDKNKMAVGKGKQPINNVIAQEAVPTRNISDNFVSEPVIYLIGSDIIGAFLRANTERGASDNLNAKGMSFYRYCSLRPVEHPSECMCNDESQFLYHFLGKLSAVAAARENI